MVEANQAPLPADAYVREATATQQALIRANGAEPVYVLPPVSLPTPHAHRLAEEGAIRLIAFDDPELYPGLYKPEAHYDPKHLTREAAAWFSRAFASTFATLLKNVP